MNAIGVQKIIGIQCLRALSLGLLLTPFGVISADGPLPFSKDTLYIAKWQFSVNGDSNVGAWRWAPDGTKFNFADIRNLLEQSYGPGTVSELGKMQQWEKRYIVAVVTPPGKPKQFVFFNGGPPVNYKSFIYNAGNIPLPKSYRPVTLKLACQEFKEVLGKYKNERNTLVYGPLTLAGKTASGCTITFETRSPWISNANQLYYRFMPVPATNLR